MATFISTTLAKRTGATTTVFAPGTTSGNSGVLFESSTLAGYGAQLQLAASRSNDLRRSTVTFKIPMLSADGLSILRYAQAKLEIVVPDGMLQTSVDDLIGYVNAATNPALTNLNDILVDGDGIY